MALGDLSEVDARGECGDTVLHWAVILPNKHSVELIRSYLDIGIDVTSATTKECPLSDSLNGIDIMPWNTTALDWAVIVDNLAALLLMKNWIIQGSSSYLSAASMPLTSLLSYATQYQSVRCIESLCMVSHEVTFFDTRGFSPFYYAVRPDIKWSCSLIRLQRPTVCSCGRDYSLLSPQKSGHEQASRIRL